MAAIDVGRAIGAGFLLMRRKPEALVVWGAISAALFLIGLWLAAPVYAEAIARAARAVKAGAQAAGGPGQRVDDPTGLLRAIAGLFVGAVLQCAVFRAVLHPQDDRWAYMRVGEPELIYVGLLLGFGVTAFIAVLVIALLGGLLGAFLAVAKQTAAAVLAVVGVAIAAFGAMVYGWLRVMLIGPQLVDTGRLDLAGGLALTRGRAGSLFLTVLSSALIIVLVEGSYLAVFIAAVASVVLQGHRTAANAFADVLRQPPQAWLSRLMPLLVGFAVAAVPIRGAVLMMAAAPMARVYRDLQPDPADAF